MMSRRNKPRSFYLQHPGEPLEQLPLFMEKVNGKTRYRGKLLKVMEYCASQGRIWYLPKSGTYAFRVVCKPACSVHREMWVTTDNPYTNSPSVLGFYSQRYVEVNEPQRAQLTSSQYHGILAEYYIHHNLFDLDWHGRGLSDLEKVQVNFSKEPFKSAIEKIEVPVVGPKKVRKRTHWNVVPEKVKAYFRDGSFMEIGLNDHLLYSNTTCTEVGDATSGRTSVLTDWQDAGGFA